MDTLSQLSFGDSYTGIGFDATRSMHFDDLKRDQGLIKQRSLEVIRKFAELKSKGKKWETRKENAEADGSSLWPSEVEEEMTLSMEQSEFSQTRQDLIQYIRIWAQDASDQLAMYPGFNPEDRRKRALDFVNLQKKYLKTTTPLGEGEEEKEEDEVFLKNRMTELPPPKEDSRLLRDRLRSSRSESKRKDRSPSAAAPLRTSTPSGPEKARSQKEERDNGDTKSKLGPENQSGDGLDGCQAIREEGINPNHQCPAEARVDHASNSVTPFAPRHVSNNATPKGEEDGSEQGGGEEGEEEDEEDDTLDGSGPNYDRVKKEDKKEDDGENKELASDKKDGMEHDEEWQNSILSKQLGRPLTEGTMEGDDYKRYKEAFARAQEEKREAEAEINRLREKEREYLAKKKSEEEEEERRRRIEKEMEEQEEKKKNLEMEDAEAIERAMAEMEKIRRMNGEKREMARRRREQIEEIEREERKEKERKLKAESRN